jgi:general secretion pathway protein I
LVDQRRRSSVPIDDAASVLGDPGLMQSPPRLRSVTPELNSVSAPLVERAVQLRHAPNIRACNHLQCSPLPFKGCTLIEVLVALSIVAITLLSGLKAMGAMTQNAQRQLSIFLAQTCADNALNAMRLSAQFPSIGEQSVSCVQSNRNFLVVIGVSTTPNSSFRRVDAQVFEDDVPQIKISTIIGRI